MTDLPTDPDIRDERGRPRLRVSLPDEEQPANEITMARSFLAFLRESAIAKIGGLDSEQLRWAPAPGANSIGALGMHLGDVERFWIRQVFAGETVPARAPRATSFAVPDGWKASDVITYYRGEIAAADDVLDGAVDPDAAAASNVRPTTLRWILFHLVEELARHVGHIDITRELIDGSRGR